MQRAARAARLAEADPEVSEAIDFCRWYARHAEELEQVDGAEFEPDVLDLVTPPWNFPLAIPTGSTVAPLAAGAAVIHKPSPQTVRCSAALMEALWEAGVPRDVLQLVDAVEGDTGKALVSHPGVDRIVLTGAYETAELFGGWGDSWRGAFVGGRLLVQAVTRGPAGERLPGNFPDYTLRPEEHG